MNIEKILAKLNEYLDKRIEECEFLRDKNIKESISSSESGLHNFSGSKAVMASRYSFDV